MNWKDSTSYSRWKEKIPTCFTADLKNVRITVMSSHIYNPGVWVFSCSPWFDAFDLNVDTVEEAKEKALKLVKQKLAAILQELES